MAKKKTVTPEAAQRKLYVEPVGPMITRAQAPELYDKEEISRVAFRDCSEELGRIMGHGDGEYWTHTMPEALLSFLNGYDRQAVRVAVKVWLERNPGRTRARASKP